MAYTQCYIWKDANIAWPRAGWTWSECWLVQEIVSCIWGHTGVLWRDANWKWSECSASVAPPEPLIPIITIQPPGIDAETLIQPWLIEPWNPHRNLEKKERLIRLICKVRGEDYDETKEIKNIQIKVEDVSLIIKEALGINLNIMEIKNDI